jgi:diaminohydroxyphosphoribosylaminopyrimidine deaminase/5-amino-6-(5-phosphoribosylamino)uracil reductase
MEHISYMRRVLTLAQQGTGLVSPNPLVGALIVKDELIIGTGYHERYGSYHAELQALLSAKESVAGATLYCNLEPCCHTNKQTPPCAQRIIKEKIARVVIANSDPNPLVNGSGIRLLKQAGIEVIEGICQAEGELVNEIFFTFHRKKRPFICLKYAQTLDGNIACDGGDSKWITPESCRKKVHEMRAQFDAVLVGVGTLVADNPQLTIRLFESEKKCPRRIVLGSLGLIGPTHFVVTDEFCHKTILITNKEDLEAYSSKAQEFSNRGITICSVDSMDGFLNLSQIVERLSQHSITSVLVEGGSKIITSFIQQNLYDTISVFIAPKIIGTGIRAVNEMDIKKMNNALSFSKCRYEIIDDIIHFNAKPNIKIEKCLPD